MSQDQNVEWNHNLSIENSSFESLEQFRCLGITLINHNSVQEEVVKPLYEKGDKTSVTNYGPVWLLTVFPKVPKTAMHSTWNQHLHTKNILVTGQYSFRKEI